MNRVKRTARKRHIRQSINKTLLNGKTPMQGGGVVVNESLLGEQVRHLSRDHAFAALVAASAKPTTKQTPAEFRRSLTG